MMIGSKTAASGPSLGQFDPRYVNVSGDTMTGILSVVDTGTLTETIAISGIHIGRVSASSHRIIISNGTGAQNWELDNSSGTFRIFQPGANRLQLDGSGNLRHTGYLRVGSISGPTNTTAGDITGVRIFTTGVASFGSETVVAKQLHIHSTTANTHLYLSSIGPAITFGETDAVVDRADIGYATSTSQYVSGSAIGDLVIRTMQASTSIRFANGTSPTLAMVITAPNVLTAGYVHVGSTSAPNNTTAGDLTATRLSIGNVAFASGQYVDMRGTMTNTASGAQIGIQGVNTLSPASNSSSEFRALYFRNIANAASGITFSTITGNHIEGTRIGSANDGAITTINGINCTALVTDSGSVTPMGTVTTVNGLLVSAYGRPSGSAVSTITNAYGISTNIVGTGSVTVTNAVGLIITAPGTGNTITNLIGVDITTLVRGTTINIGLRIAYPGLGSSISTNTDVTALQIPTASVSLGNQLATSTNAFGIHIGIPTYTSTTNVRTVTNMAALYIAGAPVASTNVTVTAGGGPYSIWVDAGTTRLDGELNAQGDINHDGTNIGFYNVTPVARPSAYTQTYATADKTHANFTSADLATTAATNTTPYGFATQAQADNIATQFNLLRADVADVKQLINSVIDDLQSIGLLQ